jgi:hypothetical protein
MMTQGCVCPMTEASLETMIAEEIRDGISTDIHFDLVGVDRVAEIIAWKIRARQQPRDVNQGAEVTIANQKARHGVVFSPRGTTMRQRQGYP